MLIDLIAAIAAGFVAGGALMVARMLLRGRIPGWTIPVAAGVAMIGYTVWAEYSWYDRTIATLPDSVEILSAPERRSSYRPWTYLIPLKDRFIAVDTAAVRRNPAMPDQRLAEIMVAARYGAQGRLPVLIDCAERRRADLVDGVDFTDDGGAQNVDWRTLEQDDPLAKVLCDVN